MNQYITGTTIRDLRQKNHLTQSELADKLNVSANMLHSQFYVCPVCGNIVYSTGELAVSCHGIQLLPELAEKPDDNHMISIERIEDDYYVQINHSMAKDHYISFIAALSPD